MAINNSIDTVPTALGQLLSFIESVIDFKIYVLGFSIDQDKIQNIASEIIENNLLNENTIYNLIIHNKSSKLSKAYSRFLASLSKMVSLSSPDPGDPALHLPPCVIKSVRPPLTSWTPPPTCPL